MIASFPMYDRPSTRAGYDALWVLIRNNLREAGLDAPDALDHDMDHMQAWAQDDLVLGQICNMPLQVRFQGRVTTIGTADYGLPDCPQGHYFSLFIVHADSDLTDPIRAMARRFAVNDLMSQSGFGSAHAMAAQAGFDLKPALVTGAHSNSLTAVVTGSADCAAIDAQTWRHLLADDPQAAQVRVIGRSHSSPGMTYITAGQRDPEPYFAAIKTAIADLPEAHRAAIHLRDIVRFPAQNYDLPIPAATLAHT